MANDSAYHSLGHYLDDLRLATRLTARTEKEIAQLEQQSAEEYTLTCADADDPCPAVLSTSHYAFSQRNRTSRTGISSVSRS